MASGECRKEVARPKGTMVTLFGRQNFISYVHLTWKWIHQLSTFVWGFLAPKTGESYAFFSWKMLLVSCERPIVSDVTSPVTISFRNAQGKWSLCSWMLKNMDKSDNLPLRVFTKWSRYHWLDRIVDYLQSIFKAHSSFKSYSLRSTIAIRRSLRQPFLKRVYI